MIDMKRKLPFERVGILCCVSVPCFKIRFSQLEYPKTAILIFQTFQIQLIVVLVVSLLADPTNALFRNFSNSCNSRLYLSVPEVEQEYNAGFRHPSYSDLELHGPWCLTRKKVQNNKSSVSSVAISSIRRICLMVWVVQSRFHRPGFQLVRLLDMANVCI